MRLGTKQFTAIAALTAIEAFRQPVTLLLTASSVAFVGLLPLLVSHTLGDGQRLVRDSGLALFLVTGLVLGAFTSCAALSQDIRKGTAAAVLSKPVARSPFFLAKFAGVAISLVMFSAMVTCAVLMSTRTATLDFQPDWWGVGPLLAGIPVAFVAAGIHHYFARGPFASRAYGYLCGATAVALLVSGLGGAGFSALPWNILPACALIALAILVLSGLAVSLAIRLDVVPVLTVCSLVLMLGLISDYLVGHVAAAHRAARIALNLLPNWQHFWAVDALARDGIPVAYVAHAAAYAALYLAGILCAGIFAFRRMEIR